jgi:hypothetical protein
VLLAAGNLLLLIKLPDNVSNSVPMAIMPKTKQTPAEKPACLILMPTLKLIVVWPSVLLSTIYLNMTTAGLVFLYVLQVFMQINLYENAF